MFKSAGQGQCDVKTCFVNRARIPPGKMKLVKIRYNGVGHVPDQAIFGVRVVNSSMRLNNRVDQRSGILFAEGWEPEQDDPCFGHPTVKVVNLTNEWVEVEPQDI